MNNLAKERKPAQAPLAPWGAALTHSLDTLAGMLNGISVSVVEEPLIVVRPIGNYIDIYGDAHAFRLGLSGDIDALTWLTRTMVGAGPDEVLAPAEVYDGVGELVNVLIGNIKTWVAPNYKHLSIGLPVTLTGEFLFPEPEAHEQLTVAIGGVRIALSVSMFPLPLEVRRQRELEQAMREREARLQSILNTAADAIITMDEGGVVTSVNASALRIFAVDADACEGQPARRILPHIDVLLATFDEDDSARETVGLRAGGAPFPVELSFSRVSVRASSLTIAIARDISERKALEEELNHSRRLDAIGQLAAGIAHEINTPIQYVGDNMQFLEASFADVMALLQKYGQLKDGTAGQPALKALTEEIAALEDDLDLSFLSEEIPKALAQSLEGVGRVATIVQAMKAFSHPNKEKSPVDLNRELSTTITVCRNEWKYFSEMETHFDPGLPMVICVAGEMNQVFLNIIVNAAQAIADKHRERGGKGVIRVTTAEVGGWVEVRISDTGGGIPKACRDKIFVPFFTTKDVGKGTGQGLSLARTIVVKQHGGEIFFESQEGIGTTFVVRLPICSI